MLIVSMNSYYPYIKDNLKKNDYDSKNFEANEGMVHQHH